MYLFHAPCVPCEILASPRFGARRETNTWRTVVNFLTTACACTALVSCCLGMVSFSGFPVKIRTFLLLKHSVRHLRLQPICESTGSIRNTTRGTYQAIGCRMHREVDYDSGLVLHATYGISIHSWPIAISIP